jgi:hypothetical protein
VHGWTKEAYCAAFGLERGQSLEGPETRKLRAAAQRHGYPDIGAFALARVAGGACLAAISREAGLHKDWLSRHLGDVDPAASAAARQRCPNRWDARWRPALNRLGFPDVPSYLRERHIVEHRTVNAIAAEVGLTNHAESGQPQSWLRRHAQEAP